MRLINWRWLPIVAGLSLLRLPLWGQGSAADQFLAEGDRLAWLKNWQSAEPFFAKAETAFHGAGDKRNELYAKVSRLRGELPKLSLMETSQALADTLDNPLTQNDLPLRLRCLVVKGDVDLDLDTELAERDWTEALSVATKLNDPAWINRANGELGIIAFLHGDSRTATLRVAGALTQARKLNDVGAQIRYLTLIGNGLVEFQRSEQSLGMFDEAIGLAKKTPGLGEPVMTYAGKATALVSLNRISEARGLLDSLLDTTTGKQEFGYESEALEQLAKLEVKAGQTGQAVVHLRKAVEVAASVDGYRLVTDANLELSRILLREKRPIEAEQAALGAVAASRKIGDKFLLPRALAQLASVEVSRSRFRDADRLFEEATDIVNGMLANTASASAKSSVVSSMDAIFLGHFELQADRLKNSPQAFRIIEAARGRSIADALRFRVADQPLRSASLTATEKEISRLQLKLINAKPTERKRLLEELFTLEQRVGLVEAATRPPWLQKPHQPLPLARVQAALGPDEVLLEYVLDEPLSHCLAIERSRTRIFTLPARSQIEKQVNQVADSLKKQTSNFEATAAQLYESIVSPAAAAVSSKARVVIVADGPLYDLPFEMLGPRQSQPLLMSHVVTYAPSATVYTMLSEDKPAGATLPVLAVGTGSDTPGPDTNGPAVGGKPFGTINREVFETDSGQLIPLAAANGEARLVADALGPGGVVLTGTAASESALKKQPLDRFRVLHFAVHGLVSTKFPERSALVLYPDAIAGEDGYWQAREVGRTKLNAELVTLSACDVGSGRLVGQEGVANLVRPFLMAGARTVVANLWESNDDFTHGLMREFYTRLASGTDKGRALQEAKLAMIRKFGADATPRLWSGFIMVGENRRSLVSR